jgi:RNA polymerase sigma-70 factor (ECF subfamily)
MTNVNKDMAASASASALPALGRPRSVAGEERVLLVRAQSGVPEACEELVRRHQRRVMAVAASILHQREDAEDVSQQVFLKAFAALKRFDMRSAFSTWLYKITVNECWDFLRRRRVRPLLFESDLSEDQAVHLENVASPAGDHSGPPDHIVLSDTVGRLLRQLGEEDRTILLLKEVQGFSVKEIAEMLQINVNTVKVRLFRTRVRLAEYWRRHNPDQSGAER